jgi:hypothetical protein
MDGRFCDLRFPVRIHYYQKTTEQKNRKRWCIIRNGDQKRDSRTGRSREGFVYVHVNLRKWVGCSALCLARDGMGVWVG